MPLRLYLNLVALAAAAALVAVIASLLGVDWYWQRRRGGLLALDPLWFTLPLLIGLVITLLQPNHTWGVNILLIFNVLLGWQLLWVGLLGGPWSPLQGLFLLLLIVTNVYAWRLRYYMDD